MLNDLPHCSSEEAVCDQKAGRLFISLSPSIITFVDERFVFFFLCVILIPNPLVCRFRSLNLFGLRIILLFMLVVFCMHQNLFCMENHAFVYHGTQKVDQSSAPLKHSVHIFLKVLCVNHCQTDGFQSQIHSKFPTFCNIIRSSHKSLLYYMKPLSLSLKQRRIGDLHQVLCSWVMEGFPVFFFRLSAHQSG